jgi:3-hydroxybutyryl-CoA dehydratase
MAALAETRADLRVGDKLPARSFGPFALDRLAAYAGVSGDSNPIHLDTELAQKAGLAAPPVQGMLLMSTLVTALEAWRPDFSIARLSAKFLRPVLAGETITVSGRVAEIETGAPPRVTLRLMAHNAGRDLAILAEAVLAKAG